MIDSYIILNRKVKPIMIIFILNICIITCLLIWGINTLEYQNFFHIHSKIIKLNSYYFLEVLIPVKEVNQIINESNLFIGDVDYNYSVYKVDDNIIYKDNINYQKAYLNVNKLDDKYLINNYRIEIKIPTKKQKLIKYLIE